MLIRRGSNLIFLSETSGAMSSMYIYRYSLIRSINFCQFSREKKKKTILNFKLKKTNFSRSSDSVKIEAAREWQAGACGNGMRELTTRKFIADHGVIAVPTRYSHRRVYRWLYVYRTRVAPRRSDRYRFGHKAADEIRGAVEVHPSRRAMRAKRKCACQCLRPLPRGLWPTTKKWR